MTLVVLTFNIVANVNNNLNNNNNNNNENNLNGVSQDANNVATNTNAANQIRLADLCFGLFWSWNFMQSWNGLRLELEGPGLNLGQ